MASRYHSAKARLTAALEAHEPLQPYGESLRFEVTGRAKGITSTFRKVFRQNKSQNEIADLAGLRIIVHKTAAFSIPMPEGKRNRLYTVNTFPPPLKNADSVLLHMVSAISC